MHLLMETEINHEVSLAAYPCSSSYLASRYQAIDSRDLMSDLYEPYTNSFANDWVKCSSVDSAAEEAVIFEDDEY